MIFTVQVHRHISDLFSLKLGGMHSLYYMGIKRKFYPMAVADIIVFSCRLVLTWAKMINDARRLSVVLSCNYSTKIKQITLETCDYVCNIGSDSNQYTARFLSYNIAQLTLTCRYLQLELHVHLMI